MITPVPNLDSFGQDTRKTLLESGHSIVVASEST